MFVSKNPGRWLVFLLFYLRRMRTLLLIGTGGFIGTCARYLLSKFISERLQSPYPWGTFVVNIFGCLALGLILGFSQKFNLNFQKQAFLTAGICGGFTTFSAFSAETLALLRTGQHTLALLYVCGSILSGILAVYAGYALLR
jgi:CrcB protein